mmetsp:Transcript_80301/g.139275  ORF Transcript_80301/g.139275 Transcript_80301/m.139275 type:complete len:109 (+) Transcript_80301:91-417(+)
MTVKGLLNAALFGSADESTSADPTLVPDAASLTHASHHAGAHASFTAFLPDIGSSHHDSHVQFLPGVSSSYMQDGDSMQHADFLFGQNQQGKRPGLFTAFEGDDKGKK